MKPSPSSTIVSRYISITPAIWMSVLASIASSNEAFILSDPKPNLEREYITIWICAYKNEPERRHMGYALVAGAKLLNVSMPTPDQIVLIKTPGDQVIYSDHDMEVGDTTPMLYIDSEFKHEHHHNVTGAEVCATYRYTIINN